jgi:class 3 adenylate cyclase
VYATCGNVVESFCYIHTGHSIVVTLNNRLDYLGKTVNIASRIQGLADAREIYISQEVYAYPGFRSSWRAARSCPSRWR